MIKTIRKIRQRLLIENKFNKYVLYAMGEIVLVVIGILIALHVNNLNTIRSEKQNLDKYLEKISINIKDDILTAQSMLKSRVEVAQLCQRATELIVNRDFSDQATITNAILAMTIEQHINFNRSGFESLKNSGYLRYVSDPKLENLLYKYNNAVDEVLYEEASLQIWANDLELELMKNGFTAKWLELDSKPNRKLPDLIGNYSKDLYQHPGHSITLSLLLRGHLFPAFLTGFYEEQITIGVELLKVIDEYKN
jgi:hypothetical protein